MIRKIQIAAALFALMFSGCGYADRKDPPLLTYGTSKTVQESARFHARDVSGYATGPVGSTNSMLPTIQAGDWLVIASTPFSDALLGKVCVYAPKWHPAGTVVHRLVSGNARTGFIPSGDNNARSEAFELVTKETYCGEVVGIYRTEKP